MTCAKACAIIVVAMMLLWHPFVPPGNAENARPGQGLLWNTTGLPSVFPLQVKTRPGRDYVVLLSDIATREDVLAAYIVGGQFFRVLVPPGSFNVRFASGESWQGESELFGGDDQVQILKLPEPLSFEVVGLGVKSGHMIDLTDAAPGQMQQTTVSPVRICQDVDVRRQVWSEAEGRWVFEMELGKEPLAGQGRSVDIRSRYCWE